MEAQLLRNPTVNDTISNSNTTVSITENTTAERIVAIVEIAAGMMGANGKLAGTAYFTHTSSTNSKTYKVYLGNGTGPIGGALTANTSTAFANFAATASTVGCAFDFFIGNVADQAVNKGGVCAVRAVPNNVSIQSGTINTAAAQRIIITATKATGTETVTLESLDVRLIK